LREDYISPEEVSSIRTMGLEERCRLIEQTLDGKDKEINSLNDRNKILEQRLN